MEPPPALADVRRSLEDRRGYQWVNQAFARHRRPGAAREAAREGAGDGADTASDATLAQVARGQ